MNKQVFLQQFERRAVELGCPKRKLRPKIEELDLHYDFIKRVGLKEHLSEFDAEARASKELGEPAVLGEEAAISVRRASWWGRHPIIGFILLPILMLGPALVGSVFLMVMLVLAFFRPSQVQYYGEALWSGSIAVKDTRHLIALLFSVYYLALTMLPLPFGWMARRSASGWKWAVVPCLICAAQAMFLQIRFNMRTGLTLNYFWSSPIWWGAIGPLLIAAAAWWRQANAINRLNPLPAGPKTQNVSPMAQLLATQINFQTLAEAFTPKEPLFSAERIKRALRTPTYWIMTILLVLGLFALISAKGNAKPHPKAKRPRATQSSGQQQG